MKPFQQDIRVFPTDDWVVQASHEISKKITDCLKEKKRCSLMLTGGNTVKDIYVQWAKQRSWDYQAATYYFGDERCVSPKSQDSNYSLANKYFFTPCNVASSVIYRMEGELADTDWAASKYESVIPDYLDVLLFSMGEDGHIASIFPNVDSVFNTSRLVLPVTGAKFPFERLTITPKVIKSAKSIFLFARGKQKGKVLAKALDQPENINELPVRLLLSATWLLDDESANCLSENALI